jgi:mannosyl-3-phosphoglycerate phosphatase
LILFHMEKCVKLVIFTDLDGSLLDRFYSYDPALPALESIKEKGIPLIICSSKTRPEIEQYRARLSNAEPFITENGGGIFIPKSYFSLSTSHPDLRSTADGRYAFIPLGSRYEDLRSEIMRLRAQGFSVKGFGDMSSDEVARLTGLSQHQAEMAKRREFDEPFLFEGTDGELHALSRLIGQDGFFCTQGSFLHLTGPSNKGKAVSITIGLYRREYQNVTTAALGDAPNDIPMLQAVDYPIIVPNEEGSIHPGMKGHGFAEAGGPGPMGWNKAVLRLIETLGQHTG